MGILLVVISLIKTIRSIIKSIRTPNLDYSYKAETKKSINNLEYHLYGLIVNITSMLRPFILKIWDNPFFQFVKNKLMIPRIDNW